MTVVRAVGQDLGETINTTLGFRSLSWDWGGGLSVNGQHTKIRGFCNHNECAPALSPRREHTSCRRPAGRGPTLKLTLQHDFIDAGFMGGGGFYLEVNRRPHVEIVLQFSDHGGIDMTLC